MGERESMANSLVGCLIAAFLTSVAAAAEDPTCPSEHVCPPCPEGRKQSFDAYIYRPSMPKIHGELAGIKGMEMVENARYFKIPLHHFCCHTEEEKEKISTGLDNIGWAPTEVTMTGGVCTTGEGGKKGIFLGVDKKSHKELLSLTRLIRDYGGKENGIKLGPRIDAFRARLATVESTYDVAKAIQLVDNHGSLEPFTFQYFNCGMLTIQAARL